MSASLHPLSIWIRILGTPGTRHRPWVTLPVDQAMSSSVSAKVEPLTCRACGAPVPLPRADEGRCDSCDAPIRLPAKYRALLTEAEQARQARREAEERLRKLPRPFARWVASAAVGLIVVLGAGFTTAALIAWAFYGVFESVRDMLMLGVFTPMFLVVWGVIEAVAASSYTRHIEALSALPPEEEGRKPLCRVCGAPLPLEPDALAATCDYCQTDSLVTRLASRRREQLERSRREVALKLGQAVSALEVQRGDQKLLRVITLVVLVGCWLGFWFGLPH